MSTSQRIQSARAFGLALRAARLERELSQEDVSVPAWPMAGPSREAEDALDIANTPQGCTGGADGRGTGAR
jgi:hypothetical protein